MTNHHFIAEADLPDRNALTYDLGEGMATLIATPVAETVRGYPQWFITTDEGIELGTYVNLWSGDALAEAAEDLL